MSPPARRRFLIRWLAWTLGGLAALTIVLSFAMRGDPGSRTPVIIADALWLVLMTALGLTGRTP